MPSYRDLLRDAKSRITEISPEEAEARLGQATFLDVREQDEHDDGSLAGTRNVPYRLLRAWGDRVDDRPVVTVCNTGARAAIAASILAANGVEARPVLHGGAADLTGRNALHFARG